MVVVHVPPQGLDVIQPFSSSFDDLDLGRACRRGGHSVSLEPDPRETGAQLVGDGKDPPGPRHTFELVLTAVA